MGINEIISKEEIERLADLSRLTLSPEEIDEFVIEINQILSYVRQLADVDTIGLSPTYQVSRLKNVFRDDQVIDYGYTKEALLKNLLEIRDQQIVVDRMV